MADQNTPKPRIKRIPGTLTAVEYYKSGRVRLTKDEQNAIESLVSKISQRDQAARREEVILVWKKHLYDRGLQHILPRYSGGWELPGVGSGYNPQDQYSRSMFTANIYNPYGQMVISVLTREIPTGRWEPEDPNNDVDIAFAEGAEKLEMRVDQDDKLLVKMAQLGRFLWLDGRSVAMTTYQLDGQRYGYETPDELEDEEDETVPEDESAIGEQERASGEGMPESGEDSEEGSDANTIGNDGNDGAGAGDEDEELGSDKEPAPLGKPRGHEVIEFGGALEWKLPIKESCLADCSYAQRNREIPVQIAKAKYPWVADRITPSNGGPGGDDIDRLARVNVRLGVLDNFNTTDTQVQDVTEQKTFLRPAELLAIDNDDVREKILALCPLGMYVTFCGKVFCEAYNASMDDHLTLFLNESGGDGMHRPGLGDWLVPIQDVLNNWLELANDYFVRGVPNRWMDNEMFNLEALGDQTNVPGAVHGFDREPGVTMEQVIWEETPLVFPPELTGFIQDFRGEMAQLLTGAVNAMTGGGDPAGATETFGGMLVQRDQALGRQGLPWRVIKEGIPNVKRQAITMLAQNHDSAVTIVGDEAVTVSLAHMKGGKCRAVADVDENIPASYTQKVNALDKLFATAVTTPQLAELIFNPDNLDVFQRYGGLDELYFPQVAARDKQLGEITLLLKGEPLPNPVIDDLKQQIATVQQGAQQAASGPAGLDPQIAQQAQAQITQLQQQAAKLPPTVSSIPIGDFDDNDSELFVCVKVLNSSRGRELKNSVDEQEVNGYQNLLLHAKEHQQAAQAKAAQNQKPSKAPSVSIALKDLPPPEAAAAATQAGLPGNVKDFTDQDAAEALSKHPGPGGITVQ